MIINVKAIPKSEKSLIEKIGVNEFKAYIKSPPENNRANIELLKLLKRHFKVETKIIKGLKSKNKIIKIGN